MFLSETKFKPSSIGDIPRDWQIQTLAECSKTKEEPIQTGPFGAQLHSSDYKETGVPLILIKNVMGGKIVEEGMPRIAQSKADELSRYKLRAGDIVFSRVGSVGRAAIIEKYQEGWLLSGQMLRVRLENPDIDNKFLSYAISTNWFQKALTSKIVGATRKSINTEILSSLPMLVPSLSEQRQIVNVLGVVDCAIELADRIIAQTERLKRGLMQQLLTRGIEHTETKQTPIGNIPKEWQVVKLGDVSIDFIGGGTPSTAIPEYWNGDIAWMTSAHINGKQITRGQKYITKKGLENSATHLIPKGNLLVATRVGIGKVAVNTIDIAISQDLTGVIINREKALPEFLYWVLINNENRLKALAQGSTIKGLLKEDLGKFQIPLPPLEEQQRIDEILSTADRKLELEREEKVRLERIKRGLMDLLLTGKVRIKVD